MHKSTAKYRLSDCFKIPIDEIATGRAFTFEVHLYLLQNDRLILWKQPGDSLSRDEAARYRTRGLAEVWIHHQARASFEGWQKAALRARLPLTPEGALLRAVIATRQAPLFAREMGRALLSRWFGTDATEAQQRIQVIVMDLFSGDGESQPLRQLSALAGTFAHRSRRLSISNLSVLLALACEKADRAWLSALALSALLGQTPSDPAAADLVALASNIESGHGKRLEILERIASQQPDTLLATQLLGWISDYANLDAAPTSFKNAA